MPDASQRKRFRRGTRCSAYGQQGLFDVRIGDCDIPR